MRNEEDIINLRDQYQEQLSALQDLQREFSVRLDLNSSGITRFPEIPMIKTLKLEIERLDWVLGVRPYYPGLYYRTVEPEDAFEKFVEGRWVRAYSHHYDLCKVHGTFERGESCFHCHLEYREANPIVPVAPALDGVHSET